jgi:hypothetical protein
LIQRILFDTGSTLTTRFSGLAKKSFRPGLEDTRAAFGEVVRHVDLQRRPCHGRRAARSRGARGRGVRRLLAGHHIVFGPAVDQGIQGRTVVDVEVHGHQPHVVVAGAAVEEDVGVDQVA